MKVELKTKDLERELNLAQQLVGRSKFDYIALEALAEQMLLTATDYDNVFNSVIDCDIIETGWLGVANRKLTDLVKLFDTKTTTISGGDNGRANVISGAGRFKLMAIERELFPEQPLTGWRGFWKLPTALMQRAIEAVAFAIPTTDSERFQMRCANLSLTPLGMRIVTTDGRRVALFETPLAEEPFDDFEALLTDRAVSGLAKLCGAGGELEIEQDDNHIFFRVGRRSLSVRKLIGTFPDISKVLIDNKPGYKSFSLKTNELVDALRKAMVMAEQDTRSVNLKLSGDVLTISTQSVNSGEGTQELAVDNLLDIEIEMMFDVRLALDFLETIKDLTVLIDVKEPTAMLQLRPAQDTYKQRYIMAPMKVRA